MKKKTKKIILCLTNLCGIGICIIALITWSKYGPLTFWSFIGAIIMYIIAPNVLAYGALYDRKIINLPKIRNYEKNIHQS